MIYFELLTEDDDDDEEHEHQGGGDAGGEDEDDNGFSRMMSHFKVGDGQPPAPQYDPDQFADAE